MGDVEQTLDCALLESLGKLKMAYHKLCSLTLCIALEFWKEGGTFSIASVGKAIQLKSFNTLKWLKDLTAEV